MTQGRGSLLDHAGPDGRGEFDALRSWQRPETRVSEAPPPVVIAVPAQTRGLLTAWLSLALGSLVAAGIFAILVAFARTPAV